MEQWLEFEISPCLPLTPLNLDGPVELIQRDTSMGNALSLLRGSRDRRDDVAVVQHDEMVGFQIHKILGNG